MMRMRLLTFHNLAQHVLWLVDMSETSNDTIPCRKSTRLEIWTLTADGLKVSTSAQLTATTAWFTQSKMHFALSDCISFQVYPYVP